MRQNQKFNFLEQEERKEDHKRQEFAGAYCQKCLDVKTCNRDIQFHDVEALKEFIEKRQGCTIVNDEFVQKAFDQCKNTTESPLAKFWKWYQEGEAKFGGVIEKVPSSHIQGLHRLNPENDQTFEQDDTTPFD